MYFATFFSLIQEDWKSTHVRNWGLDTQQHQKLAKQGPIKQYWDLFIYFSWNWFCIHRSDIHGHFALLPALDTSGSGLYVSLWHEISHPFIMVVKKLPLQMTECMTFDPPNFVQPGAEVAASDNRIILFIFFHFHSLTIWVLSFSPSSASTFLRSLTNSTCSFMTRDKCIYHNMRKHLEVHFLPLIYQIMVLTFKIQITVTIMVKIICLRGLIGKH